MDFDLTPEQEQLRDTAEAFARKESPPSRLRKLRDDPVGYSKALWKKMGDLGWLGVLFPEDHGGYGGAFVDAALLLEQIGSTLVPEPYIPSVILGGVLLSKAGDAGQRERWLAPMIAGDTTLAFAYAEEDSRYEATRVKTQARREGAGYRLRGRKTFVLNGHAADQIIVLARTSGGEADRAGLSLFVVDRGAKGLAVQPIKLMDSHKGAAITLEDVEVAEERLLGQEGQAAPLVELALDYGAAAACAEAVGIMRVVLNMTTEYLATREQFGTKIGAFQALQHRAVDMFVETELARSASLLASLRVESPDAAMRLASISAAKAQVAMSGRFVTQQSIQLHGGIGVTDEHDVGLYFKRMHILNTLFGDEEHHVARFAAMPAFTAGL
jgi:alkylation response protein AidB-like acyl-CoA dehydrogenase